jgi:thiamine kinase-like enzyme
MNKIGIGRTAEVYDYEPGKVLKLFYKNIADEIITTEYNNNRFIESLGIPSAKCFDIIQYDDRKGLVLEKISGLSMMKTMEMHPLKSISYAIPLARTHYQIHKSVSAKLPNNKEQLILRIRNVNILSTNIKNKIYDYIQSLDDDSILCHSDFHPENIIINNNKFIVFDWSTATIGNKYSDVAHTNLLLRYGVSPDTKNIIELYITNKVRNSFADKYLNEYIKIANCNKKDIYKWEIPHMASMLNDIMSDKTKDCFIQRIESL